MGLLNNAGRAIKEITWLLYTKVAGMHIERGRGALDVAGLCNPAN